MFTVLMAPVLFSVVLAFLTLVAVLAVVIRALIRDKRIEDAMERQRAEGNREMWARVNERLKLLQWDTDIEDKKNWSA